MIYELNAESLWKKFKGKLIVAGIVLLALIALVIGYNIYMEATQLKEIGGLQSIYYKNLFYKLLFSAAAFVIIFIAVTVTNIFIKRNVRRYMVENAIPVKRMPNLIISFVIAFIGALACKDFFYQKALNFFNYVPFGSKTPLFSGKDVGYFVFQRPFLMALYDFLTALWVIVIIYTVVYYVLMFLLMFSTDLNIENFRVKSIIRHNLINIAIFFIIKVVSYKFQQEGIVFHNFLDLKGAGYVDVHIWLNYYRVAPFLLIAIVLAAFAFIWRGKLKHAAASIAVFPVVWILVLGAVVITQNFIVKPNESSLEKPYIKNNMEQTRLAYGIDKIKSSSFELKDLTADIVNDNLGTKDNIRLVDYQSTLRSNIQLQSNKNFYTFSSGDFINYTVNGKDTPVFITARELDKSKLSQSYINKTFKYTHGYGVVVNPINKLTPQGQIDFLLSGLRMDSVDKEGLKVTEPRIYYGEDTSDYVITNSANSGKLKEVDYDGSTETSYSGKGGLKLNWINRLFFALKYGDFNMIISGNISSDSKLLLNRQVVDRAQKAVPFLSVDSDPYIVMTKEGKLVWVLDAYTSTSDFPYSQTPEGYSGFNYIKNSVKITVDAYDGSVKYYIIDKTDPLIQAYNKMYPGIFSEEPLPEYITSHMRYPEELFKIQTEIMKRYHLNPNDAKNGDENISMFYTNQDSWNIAKYPDASNKGSVKDIDPYYNMIKLPDGDGKKEELILMRPFTPSGEKHNMVSWLAVKNSADEYGKMILYNFPENTNILGPDQVEQNINAISEISSAMTLWGQNGSTVFKGSLLVIPIEQSVLYVEPIFIQSDSASSIPQMRKVVVGYQLGNDFKHGLGDNLDQALQDLFGNIKTSTGATTTTPSTTTAGDTGTTGTTGNAAGGDKQKTISDIQSKIDDLKKQLDALSESINQLNK